MKLFGRVNGDIFRTLLKVAARLIGRRGRITRQDKQIPEEIGRSVQLDKKVTVYSRSRYLNFG